MLGIEDDYEKFCVDEAACYVYNKLSQPKEQDGNEILKKIAKRK